MSTRLKIVLGVLGFLVIAFAIGFFIPVPSIKSNQPTQSQPVSATSSASDNDVATSSSQSVSNSASLANAESEYESCLVDAQTNYNDNLQANCLPEDPNDSSYGCAIALQIKSALLTAYEDDKSQCEAHYEATISASGQ